MVLMVCPAPVTLISPGPPSFPFACTDPVDPGWWRVHHGRIALRGSHSLQRPPPVFCNGPVCRRRRRRRLRRGCREHPSAPRVHARGASTNARASCRRSEQFAGRSRNVYVKTFPSRTGVLWPVTSDSDSERSVMARLRPTKFVVFWLAAPCSCVMEGP